jgi:formate C-acetyltransferase
MASKETNPQRRSELERLSRTCRHVPANPARNFFEALQSVWFVHLGVWIEGPFVLNCPPSRFTQYMYPYFRKDFDSGKLSESEAVELIQYYFLKINGLAMVLPPHGFAWSQSRLGQHLCLGGYTPDGEDATNRLDWLVLEAQQSLRLPEPLVDLLYTNRMQGDFLMKCVELVKTGIGQPAMHNIDRAIASHLLHDKMPLEEARGISIIGCVQTQLPGYSAVPWEGGFNTAKMVEFALNDGRDPLSGEQLGLHTGDPETFKTYDEFYQAYLKQLEYFVTLQRTVSRTAWNVMRAFPLPFSSSTANDCIKTGKDVMEGGARYNQANGTTFVAAVDSANSLAAIRKLVYEDRKLTMKRLKEALAADFAGFEDVQRMCLDAPKYGNDDEYADSIARDIFEHCYRLHLRFPDFLGRPSKPEAYSVTVHFAVGRFTGALPCGRKARIPLTDASVSAMPGTDRNGPTALVKSAARVIDTSKWGVNHLNMKFHPTALAGIEGSRKLLSLVKTYFDLGGFHVQFNCVRSETLREAQLHPEKFRDLVVRVAGFSAFFIHLDKQVQDEIIKRTELSFR